MRCVCGKEAVEGDELCRACARITPAQASAGIRPWSWVCAELRRRHPGWQTLDPAACKRMHDRAIHRARASLRRDPDLGESLRDLMGA